MLSELSHVNLKKDHLEMKLRKSVEDNKEATSRLADDTRRGAPVGGRHDDRR